VYGEVWHRLSAQETEDRLLDISNCRFHYEDPRAASPEIREEADAATVSALAVFFPSDEGFLFYELREA
jgi:hypothetical protein